MKYRSVNPRFRGWAPTVHIAEAIQCGPVQTIVVGGIICLQRKQFTCSQSRQMA